MIANNCSRDIIVANSDTFLKSRSNKKVKKQSQPPKEFLKANSNGKGKKESMTLTPSEKGWGEKRNLKKKKIKARVSPPMSRHRSLGDFLPLRRDDHIKTKVMDFKYLLSWAHPFLSWKSTGIAARSPRYNGQTSNLVPLN